MNDDWEARVQSTAKGFAYPPTPDLTAGLRRRRRRVSALRLAQIAAILLLALVGLLAVPQIRAQVLRWLRIGAVEIVVTTATPVPGFSTGDLPSSVLDFPGETTLDQAQQHFGQPIRLPTALGAPDRVYLIAALHPIVVLAWLDASGAVDTSLHLLPSGTYMLKMYDGDLEPTQVNGLAAAWLPNPHWYLLSTGLRGGEMQMRQVDAHALVWEAADGTTYRLETNRSEDEALRIAESIPAGNG